MAGTIYTYDPRGIQAKIAGATLTDFTAQGTFVSLEPNSDLYTVEVGVQGNHTRSRSVDRSWTLKLSFPQESPNNALLFSLSLIAKSSLAGSADIIPITIVDVNRSPAGQWFSPNGFLLRDPSVDYAATSGFYVWTFFLPTCVPTNIGVPVLPLIGALPAL